MSAELLQEAPRPMAHVWIRNGAITSVIVANAPEGMSLEHEAPWCLLFGPEFEVTVTVVDGVA